MALNARQRRLLKLLRAESKRLAEQIAACEDRILELQKLKLECATSGLSALDELHLLATIYTDRIAFIQRSRERGATHKNIGVVLGVSKQAVWSFCANHGIR